MMTLDFDLDGTLVDIVSPWSRKLDDMYGVTIIPASTWQIVTGPHDITNSKKWKALRPAMQDYKNIPIYEGAMALMEQVYLFNDKRPVRIITARPADMYEPTFKLCRRVCGMVPFELILAEGEKKHLHLKSSWAFVEDRRKTVLDLAQKGIRTFIVNRSYNRIPMADERLWGIRRIDHIGQLLPIIDLMREYRKAS